MRKLDEKYDRIRPPKKMKGEKYIKNEFWVYDNKRKKMFKKIYYTICS